MISGQRGNLAPDNLIKPNMQNGSLPLSVADLLVNVSPEKRKVLLSIVKVRGLPNLTKPNIGNLSKPDIETAVMLTNDDILTAFSCVREGERVSDGMKKGSTENATLCDLTTYNRVNRSYAVQALGSMPLLSSSRLNRRFIHPERLSSPSSCMAIDSRSYKSPSKRSCTANRSFLLSLVDILNHHHVSCRKVDNVYQRQQKQNPVSADTPTGFLTTTVIRGNNYGY